MTHKRQCAAAKVMAQATGDSRRQSDDGETKRSDSESKPSKTWRKFLFIFLSISLCFFVEAKPWAAPLHTNTHTHTDARTVGQWKQCINMISRTTAEQSRAESRELMPFPGHGLRLELELGHGKVIGRCPDRLLAGHMAPPPPPPQHRHHNTASTTANSNSSDSASTAQIAGATHVHVPDTRYNSRDTRLLWELLSKCHVNSVQSRGRRCGSAVDASRG